MTTTPSHSGTDPASFLMDRFDAIIAFEKTVGDTQCGYTPRGVARWWRKGDYRNFGRYPELLKACAILESVIGTDDSYWKDLWNEY